VHRDDRPCPRSERSLDACRVDRVGGRIYVGEDRPGTHLADRLDGGHEGVCTCHDLVPRTDTASAEGEVECRRPRGDTHSPSGAEIRRELGLEAFEPPRRG